MQFQVNGANYDLTTDGTTVTLTKEGEPTPLYTVTVDQTKAPHEALQEVVTAMNTFLQGQFPSLTAQFVAAFTTAFNALVVTVTDGVPQISIP